MQFHWLINSSINKLFASLISHLVLWHRPFRTTCFECGVVVVMSVLRDFKVIFPPDYLDNDVYVSVPHFVSVWVFFMLAYSGLLPCVPLALSFSGKHHRQRLPIIPDHLLPQHPQPLVQDGQSLIKFPSVSVFLAGCMFNFLVHCSSPISVKYTLSHTHTQENKQPFQERRLCFPFIA